MRSPLTAHCPLSAAHFPPPTAPSPLSPLLSPLWLLLLVLAGCPRAASDAKQKPARSAAGGREVAAGRGRRPGAGGRHCPRAGRVERPNRGRPRGRRNERKGLDARPTPCRPTPCCAPRTCWAFSPSAKCSPPCPRRSSATRNGPASSTCSASARPPGAIRSWPSRSARPCSAAIIGPTSWKNSAATRPKPGPNTKTWQSCSSTAPSAVKYKARAWSATIEPLAPGWAGLVLLARAAALCETPRQLLGTVRHRDDGAAGGRPANGSGPRRPRGRSQTRPGRSVPIRSGSRPSRLLAGRVRHGRSLGPRRRTRGEGRGEREE